MTKKFLHVGCGRLTKANSTPEFQKNEWIETRLDIDENVTPDIISSITDMSVVDSNSFDAVYSSHNIEHLFSHEVPLALKEMHRVLCDDGFLVITCPDLQSVCEHVVNDKLTEPLYQSGMGPISPIDIIYGHRSSISSGNHYMAHKVGFTAKVLYSTLTGVGFKCAAVARQPKAFNLWAVAYKNIDYSIDDLGIELGKHTNLNVLADNR